MFLNIIGIRGWRWYLIINFKCSFERIGFNYFCVYYVVFWLFDKIFKNVKFKGKSKSCKKEFFLFVNSIVVLILKIVKI